MHARAHAARRRRRRHPPGKKRGGVLIRTDRVTKMWRGGRIESYRALVVGGNLRGCGGFGIGKSMEPEDAVAIACRMARRNIFFVDRYRGRSLTRDLVGRQNSCKVYLRATNNGLRGNPVACEILKLMGITNVVAKAHGSRSHPNVVRATFKALLTHESLEEVAMKRGLRLVNLQKAKRLRI
jgi:small subunit ribosomal protein S5